MSNIRNSIPNRRRSDTIKVWLRPAGQIFQNFEKYPGCCTHWIHNASAATAAESRVIRSDRFTSSTASSQTAQCTHATTRSRATAMSFRFFKICPHRHWMDWLFWAVTWLGSFPRPCYTFFPSSGVSVCFDNGERFDPRVTLISPWHIFSFL